MDKTSLTISILFILLIAGNVYQFNNPKTVEIPSGREQIDSTSWVQKDVVLSRNAIIDSLKKKNEAMAKRIDKQDDQIASYTSVTGRLKTQVDSLQNNEPAWNSIPLVNNLMRRDSIAIADTTFHRSKTFGNELFRVDGYVDIRFSSETGLQVRQDFQLNQLRDIKLDVVHTINEQQNRSLTYITSPDFETLDYQSSTELKEETELPKFWLGAGTATAVILGTLILLK